MTLTCGCEYNDLGACIRSCAGHAAQLERPPGRHPDAPPRPTLNAGVRAGCGHLLPGQPVYIEERTDPCGWCAKAEREKADAIRAAVAEEREHARADERTAVAIEREAIKSIIRHAWERHEGACLDATTERAASNRAQAVCAHILREMDLAAIRARGQA